MKLNQLADPRLTSLPYALTRQAKSREGKTHISLYVTTELAEELKAAADKDLRQVANWIEFTLRNYLKERK